MKNILALLLMCLTALLLNSCAQEATYTVPSIADQYISFTIDGQSMTLSSISAEAYEPSSLQIGSSHSYIELSRNSSDLTTRFTITAEDLPLELKSDGIAVLSEIFVPAMITVTNEEMSGSIYCPHTLEGSETITYEALLLIEQVTAENRVIGRFKTDPAANENAVAITDGTFDLVVPVR